MKQQIPASVLVPLIVGVTLAIVVLAVSVIHVKKVRKDFQEQMAQRMDAEAKLMKLENERSAFESHAKVLEQELAKDKEEIGKLQDDLDKEKIQRADLESALEKSKTQAIPATPK